MGNVGKPVPLQVLERSIWGLVMQVAAGASVYDLLPVYMSAWSSDIDSAAVSECKSWLDDFGLKGTLSSSYSFFFLSVSYRCCRSGWTHTGVG